MVHSPLPLPPSSHPCPLLLPHQQGTVDHPLSQHFEGVGVEAGEAQGEGPGPVGALVVAEEEEGYEWWGS